MVPASLLVYHRGIWKLRLSRRYIEDVLHRKIVMSGTVISVGICVKWYKKSLQPPAITVELKKTAQHTRQICPAWNEFRAGLVQIVGPDLSLSALIASMVGNEESWQAVLVYAEKIMLAKEAAEREREQKRNSLPTRRSRVGRRRRAYMATSVAL
nr:uncharacterized protein LOC116770851 [Danaus plexippus plexippus]